MGTTNTKELSSDKKYCIWKCSLYKGRLTTPRLLPCLHSFCETCLDNYIKANASNNSFVCNSCKTRTVVPDEGARGFKINVYVDQVNKIFPGCEAVDCDICKTTERSVVAVSMCIECRDLLCPECTQGHCRSKLTLNHHVVSLNEVASGQHTEEIRRHQKVYCSIHTEKVLEIFCETCEHPVCGLCHTFSHSQHKVRDIAEAGKHATDDLKNLLGPWENATDHCRMVYEKRVDSDRELDRRHAKCLEDIRSVYSAFKTKVLREVQTCEQDAIDQLEKQVVAIKKRAEVARDEAELNKVKYSDVLMYTNNIIESANDTELLQQFPEIKSRLENLNGETLETQVDKAFFTLKPFKLPIPDLSIQVTSKFESEQLSLSVVQKRN